MVTPTLRAALVATGILSLAPPAAGNEVAAFLAQGCLGCHGPGGVESGGIPTIAGRPSAKRAT